MSRFVHLDTAQTGISVAGGRHGLHNGGPARGEGEGGPAGEWRRGTLDLPRQAARGHAGARGGRQGDAAQGVRRAADSPAALLVLGGVLFIVSAALVLSHQVWVADCWVVVTLIGWLMLAVSLLQMFAPRSMAWPMRVLPNARYRYVVDAAQVLLGLYLLYGGSLAF
jgi:hypothetical protein